MINILKKISWYLKEEWKIYVGMLLLLLFIAIIALLPAKVLGMAIDAIVFGRRSGSTLSELLAISLKLCNQNSRK